MYKKFITGNTILKLGYNHYSAGYNGGGYSNLVPSILFINTMDCLHCILDSAGFVVNIFARHGIDMHLSG